MDDTPYRLAYEASVRAIEDQARVLEGLRSRAGTMFAAAALVTTFLSSGIPAEGGVFADFEPLSLDGVVVAAFIAAAVLTLVILWPFRFRFSVSAADMIAILQERESDPVTATEAYREVALRLEELAASLVLSRRYRLSRYRSRGVDRDRLEGLMANEGSGGQPRPKPQWPDISKPDTRGG